MGLPISLMALVFGHSIYSLLCILTYYVATSAFPYGDNSWLNKFFSQLQKHFVCGLVFGLASFPIIGYWAILQGIVGGVTFYCIEKYEVNNPWTELLRGGLGTVCLL
jgi:hypothetical protein